MSIEIYAPNIHLFASHQQKAFIPDSPPADVQPDLLWEKCRAIFHEFGITQQLNLLPHSQDTPRANLLKGILLSISAVKILKNIAIQVNVHPVWIHDSYILALNICYPQNEGRDGINITQLQDFNPNQCLLPKFIQSNLGQTLLITAFLQEYEKPQLRELADGCVREVVQISSDQFLDFNQESKLFGSPIFEYGIPGKPSPYGHILVWFFFSEQTSENFIDCYQMFADIFLYNSKIIKAYEYSRQDYEDGLHKSKQIEENISNLKKNVGEQLLEEEQLNLLKKQITELLQLAGEYEQLLRNLEYYHSTIKINTDKYAEKSKQIRNEVEKWRVLPNDYFTFLDNFAQKDCLYFQEQIKGDLSYLQHGSSMLDRAIATIRGIVEIEQARIDRQRQAKEKERDRQQQDTEKSLQVELQAIAAGIAAGSFVASSSGLLTTEAPISLKLPSKSSLKFHPFTISVVVSLLIGLVFYLGIKRFSQRTLPPGDQ